MRQPSKGLKKRIYRLFVAEYALSCADIAKMMHINLRTANRRVRELCLDGKLLPAYNEGKTIFYKALRGHHDTY